jgi:hypothetical protein
MVIMIFVAVAVLVGIGMWMRKLILKRRLSVGLGREVSDRELTSLTSWMEASDKKE